MKIIFNTRFLFECVIYIEMRFKFPFLWNTFTELQPGCVQTNINMKWYLPKTFSGSVFVSRPIMCELKTYHQKLVTPQQEVRHTGF